MNVCSWCNWCQICIIMKIRHFSDSRCLLAAHVITCVIILHHFGEKGLFCHFFSGHETVPVDIQKGKCVKPLLMCKHWMCLSSIKWHDLKESKRTTDDDDDENMCLLSSIFVDSFVVLEQKMSVNVVVGGSCHGNRISVLCDEWWWLFMKHLFKVQMHTVLCVIILKASHQNSRFLCCRFKWGNKITVMIWIVHYFSDLTT